MIKITLDRTVVEQALKALKAGPDVDPIFAGETEDALRAALAEPQEPDSPERRCGGPGCDMRCCQPVEEPVAFSVGRTLHWHEGKGVNDAQLYLAPPQRKPLSEDEIFKIENDIPDDVISDRAWTICFARAIERARGTGGQP